MSWSGSGHHLIRDGRGIPLKVITTAADVNDVTQTLALVDGIPPIRAGVPKPCSVTRATTPTPTAPNSASAGPARHLPQGVPERQGHGHTPLWFLVPRLGMPDSHPGPVVPGQRPILGTELHPGMTPASPVNDLGTGSSNLLNSAPNQPPRASRIVSRVLRVPSP
ncbi:hypothetical protein GCM10010340_35460 [Streptomyces griseoloalbus]|nr:hypothetical protein GCM10010340_35460 [Streptomyces albaduncus]